MLRKLCMPKKDIRRVLEMLVANPDVLPKIQHIDFCKYGCDHNNDCQCLGSLEFDALTARIFRDRIEHNPMHEIA